MKSFKTRVEAAFKGLVEAAKVGTVLEPVPIVLGDSEEKRPEPCVIVWADTARNMDAVPPEFKNRETLVKLALHHNANDTTADVHGERYRVLVEILEDKAAVTAAVVAQDIQPYAVEMDSEDDAHSKEDFINFVAYRVRGVDNPPPPSP